MKGNFLIERTKEGEYFFKLTSEDGHVFASSGFFETLAACKNGLHAACGNFTAAIADKGPETVFAGKSIYEVFSDENGYSFLLKGAFGEVLMQGQHFDSHAECIAAIDSISKMQIEPKADCENSQNYFA